MVKLPHPPLFFLTFFFFSILWFWCLDRTFNCIQCPWLARHLPHFLWPCRTEYHFTILYIWHVWSKKKENDEEQVETNSTTTTSKNKDDSQLISETLHQPILYAGAVFLLLYVGTEVCIGNWGYTFLITSRSSDTVAMARIMSGYWGGICAGRLFLGWLTLKVGEKRMIYGYVTVLIGMLLLLWLVPLVAVNATALVIIGITIGPLFPTTVALTSKVVPEHLRATTIGFLCAFGSGGSALFPYVGGVLIGSLGVGSLLPFCISLASMMLISWLFVPNPDASKSAYQWLIYPIVKRIRLLRC
ncbi:unnamed protein product [Absidia cylindrospora]